MEEENRNENKERIARTWNGELSLSLQESSICLNELLRLQLHPQNQHHSVIRSHSDSLTPAHRNLLQCFQVAVPRLDEVESETAPQASSSHLVGTYVNIANGDTTSHDCGS